MKALALAFLLFASTPIVIDTAKLVPGRTQVHTGGSRTVTTFREGDTVTVRVEEGKRVDTIAITREGGQMKIAHGDNGAPRPILGLDRQPVIVDGIDLEPFLARTTTAETKVIPLPAPQPRQEASPRPRYYVCPKDETMVRVKPGRATGELLCPLDGTLMKEGTGSDSQIFLLQ